MIKYLTLLSLIFLCGCASKTPKDDSGTIVSMQIMDRNGFSETISSKDRLSSYQNIDFKSPQPYKKILLVYGKNEQGKGSSKITSYHSNGQIWQYLEVVDGRAHGAYREWFSNGRLKIESTVIEGVADINEVALTTWIFDEKSSVWDEEGRLTAEIYYDKGMLQNPSFYFHPNGQLKRFIPYEKNEVHGIVAAYDEMGAMISETPYVKGKKQGNSMAYWNQSALMFTEDYDNDLLQKATYYDPSGKVITEIKNGKGNQASFKNSHLYSLIEYQNGLPEGKVEVFYPNGTLHSSYIIRDGKKHGEEWEYYPKSHDKSPLRPKICLLWQDDEIQGQVKTWYDDGGKESQKEMNSNKRHGLNFAWYKTGELMFMEEYEKDKLIRGSYFKKGEKKPVSKIESGKGTASLFTKEGLLIRKISYDKGLPSIEENP